MKTFIKNIIAKIFKKKLPKWSKPLPTEAPIVYAFSWKGKDYFCYENPANMPWMRAFVAFEFMEEFNMRATREYLNLVIGAIKNEINRPTPNLTEAIKILNALEDRLEWIVEPETLLKLASVHFFTDEESPAFYDIDYNNKKIADWKRAGVLAFFLQLPFNELTPLQSLSKESIRTYFVGQIGKAIKSIDEMLGLMSLNESEDTKRKELLLHKTRLEQLMSSFLV